MEPDLEETKRRKSLEELLQFAILNIDKPSGPTSFKTADLAKRILRVPKSCHYGTLDPNVTGVLPVGLNRACRLARWFLTKDKTYRGTMRLHSEVGPEELLAQMKEFEGTIRQLPPVRSRVKRRVREREVHYWTVTGREGRDVEFKAKVQGGTYIRKLVHDLGERLDGAHMTGLRRTQAGIFRDDAPGFVTLEGLREAVARLDAGDEAPLREVLIPGEVIGHVLPAVAARPEAAEGLLLGRPVTRGDLLEEPEADEGEDFAIFADYRFLEVARVVEEGEIIARPEFVLT